MMTVYLSMMSLSFYMLVVMWWKFILIFPFIVIRYRRLIHKFRFAVLGLLICYCIDLLVPRLFTLFSQRPPDLNGLAEWARVFMIETTIAKLAIGSTALFFLCRYYETDRRPLQRRQQEAGRAPSLYQLHKAEIMRHGLIAAAIGFIASAVMSIMSISRSTSSTAAIGYLFVPMTSLMWSVPFFVFGYSVGYLRKWHAAPVRTIGAAVILAYALSGFLFCAGAVVSVEGLYLKSLVNDIKAMNEQELGNAIHKPFFGKNKFVLGAVAQNKNASGELLKEIGMSDDPELYEKMWSLFDVMCENRHGLAVMRLVARNHNVLPETLEHLAQSSNEYVLGDVAGNEKTSVETLIRLSRRKNYLIDWGLARNPLTPPDILSGLSRSDNEYTRAPAAQNPGTVLKDLELLASDREWNVRRSVAQNPKASTELLDKLSTDTDRNVRQMVIFNHNVTMTILEKVAQDSDAGIRQQAQDALVRMKNRPDAAGPSNVPAISLQASANINTTAQSPAPQATVANTPKKIDIDRDFLQRQFARVKGRAFTDVVMKPSWWDTAGVSALTTEAAVDRLWQSKPRCCIESSQLDRNNREFYRACYQTIASQPSDERITVKCLWLMDIAVTDKRTIKEYLLANYFDHNANTSNCANCAPGDIVARVADDLSMNYEWAGKTLAAVELIERALDERRGTISAWAQVELYTHLGKLYLKTEVTGERRQRIEDAYTQLSQLKDHETLRQRYPDFERVCREVTARP
jgi:hypothetical protein